MSEHARALTAPAKPPGMDELLLPGINPANVRTSGRFAVEGVTNDMYNIAERLKEINPRLHILVTDDRAAQSRTYTIMEQTARGDDQVVFMCNVLDARVLEQVRYLIKVPFEQRYQEMLARIDKFEAEEQENELDKLTEELGIPMIRDLQECGFLDEFGGRRSSYAKASVATGGKRIR